MIGLGWLFSAGLAQADYALPQRFGGTSADRINGMALDTEGNLLLTGWFRNTVQFGGISLTSSGSSDLFVLKLDAQGNVKWAVKAGGSSIDQAQSIAVDPEGNVYVTGNTPGNAVFGTQSIGGGGFVAKLDKNGGWKWVKVATSTFLGSLAVAPQSQNVYVSGNCDFDVRDRASNELLADCHSGFQGRRGFVASLSPSDGDWRWAYPVQSDGNNIQEISVSVATAPSSNASGQDTLFLGVICTGENDAHCHFQGDPNENLPIDAGRRGNLGVLKITDLDDANGTVEKEGVLKAAFSNDEEGFGLHHFEDNWGVPAMAVDGDGNLYLTASYFGSPSLGTLTLPPVAGNDFEDALPFVAKINTAGMSWVWASVLTDDANDAFSPDSNFPHSIGRAIGLDAQGSVYVAGSYRAPVRFSHVSSGSSFVDAGLRLDNPNLGTSRDRHDAFVAQLSAQNGHWQWARHAGSEANAWAEDLAVDAGGTVFVGGTFTKLNSGDLFKFYDAGDLDAGQPALGNAGSEDMWLNSLSSLGEWRKPRTWTVGQPMQPPDPNLPRIQPDIAVIGGGAPKDFFFWSPVEQKLYPIRSSSAEIRWKLAEDLQVTGRVTEFGVAVWPQNPQIHVAGTSANVQPPGVAFAFATTLFSEAGGDVDVATKTFTAPGTGYSVLLYTVHPNGGQAQGEPTTEPPSIEVVRSEAWNLTAQFADQAVCTIGTALTDPSHSDPEGKNGFVLFEKARYDGAGADRAYDRETRRGPLLPVNRDNPATTEDDLVVVWYQTNARGVAWPAKPVRYDCRWPDVANSNTRIALRRIQASSVSPVATLPAHEVGLMTAHAGLLYWTEPSDGRIRRANADGSGAVTLISGLTQPYGITLDTVGQRVFWTERGPNGRVRWANLDGSQVTTTITGLNDPHGIVFEPARAGSNTALAICETGANRVRLGRTDADASDPNNPYKLRTEASASVPIGIASRMSGGNQTLFTTGSGFVLRKQVVNPPQMSALQIVAFGIDQPTGIATVANGTSTPDVYFTSKGSGKIYSASTGAAIAWAPPGATGIAGTGTNEATWIGSVTDTSFLIRGTEADVPRSLASEAGDTIGEVAVDRAHGKVYWALPTAGKIRRSNLDGTAVEDWKTGLNGPYGLGLASDGSQVYWTERQQLVQAATDNPGSPTTLAAGLLDPMGLHVVRDGMLDAIYLVDTGTVYRIPSDGAGGLVQVASGPLGPAGVHYAQSLDLLFLTDPTSGTVSTAVPDELVPGSPTTLISGLSRPTGIVVDETAGTIYLAESGQDRIASAALDGTNLRTAQQWAYGAVGLAIDATASPADLYWTQRQQARSARHLIIASRQGHLVDGQPALDFSGMPQPQVYLQNNPGQAGYNPNEEHALIANGLVHALQTGLDGASLGLAATSDPFVLVRYWDTRGDALPSNDQWALHVYRVYAERDPDHLFRGYNAVAEDLLPPPKPLDGYPPCTQTEGSGPPYWQDAKTGAVWARADGQARIRYFYPLQAAFHYDRNGNGVTDVDIGDCVPWLDHYTGLPGVPTDNLGRPGTPITVVYNVAWPQNVPVLSPGQTLTGAKEGLPEVLRQQAVEIVFDQQDPNLADPLNARLATLYDPLSERRWPVPALPPELLTEQDGALQVITGNQDGRRLPLDLRMRLRYDPIAHELIFRGYFDDSLVGGPLLMPNVLSFRDSGALFDLDDQSLSAWDFQIAFLTLATRNPNGLDLDQDGDTDPQYLVGLTDLDQDGAPQRQKFLGVTTPKALSAGTTTGTGYLTLAFNNDPSISSPVSLKVIRVDCPIYRGQVFALQSDNVFEESLTLRHSGDFGGLTDDLEFEWGIRDDILGPGQDANQPPNGAGLPYGPWQTWDAGLSRVSTQIAGPGRRTLIDNRMIARYEGLPVCGNDSGTPSAWAGDAAGGTRGALAEGWIKRVTAGINPFAQRYDGFHTSAVDTYISMLKQAGGRYEGDVALNPDPASINDVGLIQLYQTVLNRGRKLSIDAGPDLRITDDPAVNNALLNAASRIASLYMLIANEAYADAVDPTIGLTTSSSEYGSLAPSIFAFQNQLASPLEEELALLRGRDDSQAGVRGAPLYNRLLWNFTSGEGEVAYQQVYNVSDQNADGFIDEFDAKILYPQGHGDAWGHYLTGIKVYYDLLRHPAFQWQPRIESVSVAGVSTDVDFLDERLFARLAAAKAKIGAQIVDLTYRQQYVEDPAGQGQGYKDTQPQRAWGLAEWSSRAGEGAYLDWVVANHILPAEDTQHTGIARVDRTTVDELDDLVGSFHEIETQMDEADRGLNPLGLAKGVVPFDIDPSRIDQGKTHFEQIYERALAALTNALVVFDHANKATEQLRKTQDSNDGFRNNVADREADFKNRLIEIFGYPYADDIGPNGTFPSGYDGADLYHYMLVDRTDLTGDSVPSNLATEPLTAYFTQLGDGSFYSSFANSDNANPIEGPAAGVTLPVAFHISVDGFGIEKPESWTGSRRAPGELQLALSDIYQARAALDLAIGNHETLIADIQTAADVLEARFALKADTIEIRDNKNIAVATLKGTIAGMKLGSFFAKSVASTFKSQAQQSAECLPKVLGTANDTFSGMRCLILKAGSLGATIPSKISVSLDLGIQAVEASKETLEALASRKITLLTENYQIREKVAEVEVLLHRETGLRVEMARQEEILRQSQARFQQKLAEGQRLLEDLVRFRRQTAGSVQDYRYQDMAFRIFRNDALQKYRAQFDLAARYTYLAATAYDYETNLLGHDGAAAGQNFLTDIVRHRGLGQVRLDPGASLGVPIAGSNGLADPLARLKQNFDVLKGQLGFDNPQTETNRFSLRSERFRLRQSSDDQWSHRLLDYRVPDLWQVDEFRRYCRPFVDPSQGVQPGLVIPFETNVTSGLNYFGWPLGGGDSAYDPSHFATRVRSVGVWFTGYDGAGLSNTPRVYLVPAGADVLRSPSQDASSTREWRIVDQVLPVPFPIGATALSDPDWTPVNDSLGGTLGEIRRYAMFRAYHDSGEFDPQQTTTESRLIGRSVWNTRWLLILPGATLLNNKGEGLARLIHGLPLDTSCSYDEDEAVDPCQRDGNGIRDIKVFFQTYAYSGI